MLCQTLSHTLKLAPHERPSSQPLTKNPQQLCYFLCQTLTKDPQQVWQTLKNFDYPGFFLGNLSSFIILRDYMKNCCQFVVKFALRKALDRINTGFIYPNFSSSGLQIYIIYKSLYPNLFLHKLLTFTPTHNITLHHSLYTTFTLAYDLA